MTPELEKYYSNRLEMFTTDAWKDLIEEVTARKDEVDRIGGINTEAELNFKKGELSVLLCLIGLQGMSEEAYLNLQNEEAE
jgi:hypothetical protein